MLLPWKIITASGASEIVFSQWVSFKQYHGAPINWLPKDATSEGNPSVRVSRHAL